MQNISMVGTWHPHHQHQGQKGVGHVNLEARGDHLQGNMGGVSVDLLGLPDVEYFIGWHLASLPAAPGIKSGWPCASWRPWKPPTEWTPRYRLI